MKKIKRLHILIEWLMVICMISVGYSGWAIVVNDEASATFSMESYPVIDADDYVTIGDVSFDYGRNSQHNANELYLNSARIKIPISLKSACFTSPIFDNKIGIEITLTIVDSSGEVKKDFLLGCTISGSSDTKETGITSSGNSISFNGTTGFASLKQNLTWEDGVTVENKIVYAYVDLVLNSSDSNGIIVKDVFEELTGATLQIGAVVKDSIS